MQGLIPALKSVFPNAEHRFCLRHIHENMRQQFSGLEYKEALWRCASVTTLSGFAKCMEHLKAMKKEAQEWLSKIPAEHWARSHFSGKCLFVFNKSGSIVDMYII